MTYEERAQVADPRALDPAVLSEQVRVLYGSTAVLPVNLLNAVLTAWVAQSLYPRWVLLLWVGSLTVIVSLRLYNSWLYKSEPQPDDAARRWALRFTAGATATGCLWGLSASILLLTDDPSFHVFIAFVLGGMIAGSVTIDAAFLPAMLGFGAPTAMPAILAFFARPEPTSGTMGLMSAAFVMALLLLGVRANRWIVSLARRELAQAALAADLEKQIEVREKAEQEMARAMRTDLLSGLPNRETFKEWVTEAFRGGEKDGASFAVLYLDLDRFKEVNETLGHSFGDELLRAAAERIGQAIRNTASIARIGGDEFGIFMKDAARREAVDEVAEKIIRSVAAPFTIMGKQVHVSVSIGVSIFGATIVAPEELLRRADLALYEAKSAGYNQRRFYSEAHDRAVRERVTLFEELNSALEREEFELHYQPEVEWPSGRIIGVEALLRWNHPSRGLLGPGAFIPLAERTGLITPIGAWALANVCRQARLWRDLGICPPIVGVNVSAAQLFTASRFESDLARELDMCDLDPSSIEIELTESVLMQSSRGETTAIDRIRALGVRIAIDDFGTGYSSLEYLLTYRVNRIKIAQQFVRGLPHDPGSATIVRATIGLVQEFGCEMLAEGVETVGQLDFLVQAGCQSVQGFYFSRPVPAEEATQLLRRGVIAPEDRASNHAEMVLVQTA
ncbi:diguanylate cyclase (GGDEF)-like protein [Methylosinus sp. sav-2]|nr:diguanylate cyclase (GGDEF)-like protein [Methylosinus sp. sav-2]